MKMRPLAAPFTLGERAALCGIPHTARSSINAPASLFPHRRYFSNI